MTGEEVRDGVALTNLDELLFEGAEATKRDLVNYLEAVADRIIAELADRPLSVVRVLRGRPAFMQKNVPKYTPSWVRTVHLWAEASKREVSYALQRPPDAAVVGQSACGGVPPDACPRRSAGQSDLPGARPRPAGR